MSEKDPSWGDTPNWDWAPVLAPQTLAFIKWREDLAAYFKKNPPPPGTLIDVYGIPLDRYI